MGETAGVNTTASLGGYPNSQMGGKVPRRTQRSCVRPGKESAPPGRTLPFKHHKNDNQPQHHTETGCEVIGGAPTTPAVKG